LLGSGLCVEQGQGAATALGGVVGSSRAWSGSL